MYETNPCVDFVLVNFHGKDNDELDKFVFEKCIRFTVTKKLKYYRRKEEMVEFHMSRCKNVSHLLSTGELIYNLDGDNILDGTEYQTVSQAHVEHGSNFILHQCDGASPLTHEMFRYFNLFQKNDYHKKNLMFNGTCGRVCTSRRIFNTIGGYNERFHFMGMDDIDFIARCIQKTKCRYIHHPLHVSGKFLSNARDDLYEIKNTKNWDTMNNRFFSDQLVNDIFLDDVHENFIVAIPDERYHKHLFDLSFTTHGYGEHHRHGWNEVRNTLIKHYEHNENGILLDLFCERTYFWSPYSQSKDYYHEKPWIGFIHTTMNSNSLYSTLKDLLEHEPFIKSLDCCYGIFVLCPSNKSTLDSFLKKNKILNLSGNPIQVCILRHPTVIMENENQCFRISSSFDIEKCPLYHIGWHLRDFSKFYQLNCGHNHKKYLVLPPIYPGTFVDLFVRKSCEVLDIEFSTLCNTVEFVSSLDNDEYDSLLQTSIIFNYLIEPSGSNLITECISRTNPILINRHESIEFYLGKEYPMFYDTLEDVKSLLTNENIQKAIDHLSSIKNMYHFDFFIKKFQVDVTQMISNTK